jgi:ribulose-5-phosphate 4-epimerase/fuculose-1-phosphate aldolase
MDAVDELRKEVALACRALAMMGLVKEATGHVSARIPGRTSSLFARVATMRRA